MSIKGLFKYLSNKVCKSSLGCSYWRGGRGGYAASALQGATECQAGSTDSWEASRLGLQCELKLTLRSAPHNDLQKTADKRAYFKAGQRGGQWRYLSPGWPSQRVCGRTNGWCRGTTAARPGRRRNTLKSTFLHSHNTRKRHMTHTHTDTHTTHNVNLTQNNVCLHMQRHRFNDYFTNTVNTKQILWLFCSTFCDWSSCEI